MVAQVSDIYPVEKPSDLQEANRQDQGVVGGLPAVNTKSQLREQQVRSIRIRLEAKLQKPCQKNIIQGSRKKHSKLIDYGLIFDQLGC